MQKKPEEITVEILEIKEKFSTELTENLTTMNLAEMIKEAQYIENFNLSEQFCFQFANTKNFLATRGSIIKDYAKKQNNDHLIFHRGIQSQKIMEENGAKKLDSETQNKIIVKETNFITQQNSVFNTQVRENIIQPQQTNQTFNQNNSNKNGVQIGGGGVTYTQYLQQMQGPSLSITEIQQQSQQINHSSQDFIRQINDQNPVFQTNVSQNPVFQTNVSENPVFYTARDEQSYNSNPNQIQSNLFKTQQPQIQNNYNNKQIEVDLTAIQYQRNQNISSTQSSKIQIQEVKQVNKNLNIQCEESKYKELLYYLQTNNIIFKEI